MMTTPANNIPHLCETCLDLLVGPPQALSRQSFHHPLVVGASLARAEHGKALASQPRQPRGRLQVGVELVYPGSPRVLQRRRQVQHLQHRRNGNSVCVPWGRAGNVQ